MSHCSDPRKLALPHFRCRAVGCLGCAGLLLHHTPAQEVETSAAVHLAREHFAAVHLSLRLPLAPGRMHCCLDSRIVASQLVGEPHQLRYPGVFALLQPRREMVKRALCEKRVERPDELLRVGDLRTATRECSDVGGLRSRQVARGLHEQPTGFVHRVVDDLRLGGRWTGSYSPRWGRHARPWPPIHETPHVHIAGWKALLANRSPEPARALLARIPALVQIGHIRVSQVPHGSSRGHAQPACLDLTSLSPARDSDTGEYIGTRGGVPHWGQAPQSPALRSVVKQAHGVAASATDTQTAGYLWRGELYPRTRRPARAY